MGIGRRCTATLTGCSLVALLAACGGGRDRVAASTPVACEELAGLPIPSDRIGLPTSGGSVTEAVVVAATGTGAAALPEYCRVTGTIAPVDPTAPSIGFRVAMPTEWNRKAVMFGGGGFDGTIPNVAGNVPAGPVDELTPLGRGYATFGSDSGHQADSLGSLDGTFLLDDEALRNFGAGDALKKTRDAAVYLIGLRYAEGAPLRSYFTGGSTGGREALQAIQRWPADWDGAVAWYPAWNQLTAMMAGHRLSRAMAEPGAYPNPPKRVLVRMAALEACDSLDGLVDGLISNQPRCNDIFDPMTARVDGSPLRCPGGADTGDTCISDAQIDLLQAFNQGGTHFGYPLASGQTGYPGSNIWGADMGETTNPSPLEPTVTFLNFGTVQPTFPMPAGAPYVSRQEDAMVRYAITRDPDYNSLEFDPENPGPWADRVSELSGMLDASTDISGFVARGGKLLLAHGTSDILVSTRATQRYYQALQERFGRDAVRSFARYYEVPGYGHAVSSIFNASWDALTALDEWVDEGIAPSGQVTTDTAGEPGRTRPLCEYPTWPRYDGTGDVGSASSFSCVRS
ncbi:MAG: tannase/feruloyl esterase family alpha/beta hydrolase [Gemmatimonadota bacterium]|jgi:feruloyl esterase